MNKFDYYCMVGMSYIGAWGGIGVLLSCIWLTEYRWRLFFTAVLLFGLNGLAEASIRKYKSTTK